MLKRRKNDAEKLARVKRGFALITAKTLVQDLLEYIYAHGDDDIACDEAFAECVEELVTSLYDRGRKND